MKLNLDWSVVTPKKQPTRKEIGLYNGWKAYLKNSRLSKDEQEHRAKYFAEQGRPVPKD